jgi:hypothetical protein
VLIEMVIKMKIEFTTAIVMLVLVLLAGCGDTSVSTDLESQAEISSFNIAMYLSSPGVFSKRELSREEVEKRAKSGLATKKRVFSIGKAAQDWETAHANIKLELSNYTEFESQRAQIAAIYMLKGQLLIAPIEPAKLEAISFYTDILITHQNPDSPLLLQCIKILKEFGSEITSSQIAQAVVGPTLFLASRMNCEACSVQDILRKVEKADLGANQTNESFLLEASEALRQLGDLLVKQQTGAPN